MTLMIAHNAGYAAATSLKVGDTLPGAFHSAVAAGHGEGEARAIFVGAYLAGLNVKFPTGITIDMQGTIAGWKN